MGKFVHLHLHSDYSLLDAAQKVETIVSRVKELGMDAVALTEHGNLFSAIHFYQTAKAKGIKPIIGCEVYVAKEGRFDRTPARRGGGMRYNHLVLLAMNNIGYHNLIKLVSFGYLEGFYYKPRIDKELLKQYNEGLIATSACLKGEVAEFAAKGAYEDAKAAAIELAEIFKDRFYIEIQNHSIPEENIAREALIRIAAETGLPLVAANDAHYTFRENSESHDILFCLGSGKDYDDPSRQRYFGDSFYIKSPEEMAELFPDHPEALENTVRIAERCNVDIALRQYLQPTFEIPKSAGVETESDYLKVLAEEGLQKRFPAGIPEAYSERLEFELGVINKMGFPGYFLIVQDFVNYAKRQGIPVGPGRGSAAGSLVAYSLGITNINPIPYNLLFERFLNPERISMPDIDIDFCYERRGEVIDYIKERYGESSVCQIITFGQMKAKAVVRDVARVLKMSYAEGDRIAKLIPDELKMDLKTAYDKSQELRSLIDNDPRNQTLWKHALVLEGMNRHAGIHAAGVVITPGDIIDYVPLYKSTKDDVTTQWDMKVLDEMGIIKMDFLGLRTLTVIDHALKMLKKRHIQLDINAIPLDDEATYKIFSEGRTHGVFQFESGGMREYLKKLQPNRIEDLVAMNALYRPGPMENIPTFIARKLGTEAVEYLHPALEEISRETFGILVYQEQVQQAANRLAGYTLGEADLLRRAMGKKDVEKMVKQRKVFVEGCKKQHNIPENKANEIFHLLEKFAGYGFNKSHSVAYAVVAYQTAYLKAHYPAEFMAAYLTSERTNIKRVVELVNELQRMEIPVNPPDVNHSEALFTSDGSTIIYSINAIKNVGEKAAEIIAEERNAGGSYTSLFDLSSRIDLKSVNRKVFESLIFAGAMDSLPGNRRQKFEVIDAAIQYGQRVQEEKASAQVSLFGDVLKSNIISEPSFEDVSDWDENYKLEREKEYIGFYLSGHPLEAFRDEITAFSNQDLLSDEFVDSSTVLKIGAIIKNTRVAYDSQKRPYARFIADTLQGEINMLAFREVFEKYKDLMTDNRKVFIEAKRNERDNDRDDITLFVNSIVPIEDVRDQMAKRVHLKFNKAEMTQQQLDEVKTIIRKNPGEALLFFHVQIEPGKETHLVANNNRVNTSVTLISKLRERLGEQNVWFE